MKKIKPQTNTIFRGDNLAIMRAMPDESVDLVYIDPPFYTGSNYVENFWGDKESVQDYNEVRKIGFSDTAAFFEAHISSGAKGLAAYLEWMKLRLEEIHRILKPTGFLFIHIDYHASHYLKVILDEIFGYKNFRNEIIWKRVNNAKAHGKKTLGPLHDSILFYSKSDSAKIFEKPTGDYAEATLNSYSHDDNDGRGPYATVPLVAAGQQPNRPFAWRGITERWLYSKENLDRFAEEGLLYKTRSGKLRKKRYLSESKGPELGTIWTDSFVAPLQGGSTESTGWPTQKPVGLLERIIKIGTQERGVVFDCFAGCGTSMHAAHNLKRKWIGIDISPTAIKVNKKRLEQLGANVQIVDEKELKELYGIDARLKAA